MRLLLKKTLLILILLVALGCGGNKKTENAEEKSPHIVFVIGDEEYRSEESMPMLAALAKRELGAKVSLCYSLDSLGFIDPNRSDYIAGLEALETADLMVMFTRFRALPKNQLKYITDYAESGRPMVGFRTSTHAFLYEKDSTMQHMNNVWPSKIFGQQWITHHGHFDDGAAPLTRVFFEKESSNPLLKGVEEFDAYSWLYHVQGGEWDLHGNSRPFLMGRSLKSKHEMEGKLDLYPLENPVAWTKTYKGEKGKEARVFFTTLGHPYDWKNENMRRLALNGISWALDMDIPESFNLSFVSPYDPNNSGFGKKFKQGLKPIEIQ